MNILYLAQRVPYPPNHGSRIPTYYQIRHLSHEHNVSLVCLAEEEDDLRQIEGIRPYVSSVDVVLINRTRAKCRALAGLFSTKTLTEAYFRERELKELVRSRVAMSDPGVLLAWSSGMAQYVQEYSHVPRIMQFVDLDSQKWSIYAQHASFPMKLIYSIESRRLLDYERHLASTFDRSVLVTEAECTDFRRLIPKCSVTCVSNGVDHGFFSNDTILSPKPNSMIFTGVMDYFPNVDGVVWFCKEVLPLVQSRHKDASLTICGSSPNREVKSLSKLPGVTVTGRVDDVRPYMSRATIGVVPLRLARGVQNKLLEAMSMGLPCVATKAAYRGIEATEGTDLLVADEPQSFATHILDLMGSQKRRESIGASARARILETYDWSTQMERLDSVINSVVSNGADGDGSPDAQSEFE